MVELPEIDESPPASVWAVWRLFVAAPRWWLARGCPATVRGERGWRRVVRLSLLLAAVGAMSGVLSAAGSYLVNAVHHDLEPPAVAWLPGACFGLVALVPLSRWLGRSWWLTVPAVPVAAGAYFAAVWTMLLCCPPMSSTRLMPDEWGAAVAGACGAGLMGLWMSRPTSRRSVGVLGLVLLAGGVGGLLFGLITFDWPASVAPPLGMEEIGGFMVMSGGFCAYQALVAAALVARMWRADAD